MTRKTINTNMLLLFTLTAVILLILSSCTKIIREAKVETGSISDITFNSAIATSIMIDLGDGLSNYGHCWSTTSDPTIVNFKANSGLIKDNSFLNILTGLSDNTTYYVRAYATYSAGTVYGNQVSFTSDPRTVFDADYNTYTVIRIGTQLWMKENLKTTRYNDGKVIPLITDNATWSNLSSPGYCWFDNDPTNYRDEYGALYNWFTVNTGKLCPEGWRVPSISDWEDLISYTGGVELAANKLKSTYGWAAEPKNGTDDYGFTALPGGFRESVGNTVEMAYVGFWWSSTESTNPEAANNLVVFDNANSMIHPKKYGMSIRCIKN